MLLVGLHIDARGPTAGLTRSGWVELVDPRGHAINRLGGELDTNWHLCAAFARSAKLGNQMGAGSVTRNDANFSPAQGSLAAEKLELEGVGFQVQTAGPVIGAVTTASEAARLEDLDGDLLKIGRARGAACTAGTAFSRSSLSVVTPTQRD
jgi:hypothetical protein